MHERIQASDPGADFPSTLVLSERARTLEFGPGKVICREGDWSDDLYLVESGMVKITRSSSKGTPFALGVLGRGEVIGELSLIDGGTRSAAAEAVTAVRVRSIPREAVMEQYEQRVEVQTWLLTVLARRVRNTAAISTDLVFTSVAERVAAVLLDLAQRFGHEHDGAIRVDLALTQTEIAQLAGTTRESVNKALAAYARNGWISLPFNSLLIHDLPALHRASAPRTARERPRERDDNYPRPVTLG